MGSRPWLHHAAPVGAETQKGNTKGGHSTFPSDDTISANRGGSDGLDLRAAGGSVCEVRHGNTCEGAACAVFCHPAGLNHSPALRGEEMRPDPVLSFSGLWRLSCGQVGLEMT